MPVTLWSNTIFLKKAPPICLWLLIYFFASSAQAQDNADFAQFFVNGAALNPSYVGMDGQSALYLGYRKQWVGVPGGPSLGMASLQGLINKKLNGGLTLSSNKRGLFTTSGIMATGGYHIAVAEDKMVRFGLSVGTLWNRIDGNGIVNADPNDPLVLNSAANNFTIQGNAGVSYHTKTLHAGIALPQLFAPGFTNTSAFAVNKVSPFQTVVLHASNRFYYARNKNVFEPYLIYRINKFTPSQFELAAVVHLQSKAWVGASFRQAMGASALAGFKLNKTSIVGYSFTTPVSKDNMVPRPTHEFQLALLFGKRDKNAVGIYSFVNTDKEKKKKTPAQLAAERKARQEMLAKKYQDQNVHTQKPEQKTEEKKEPQKVEEQPKADTATVVAKQPDKPERHEFVKRGRNKGELNPGTYVIVGAFRSEANAKRFMGDLIDMEISEANYGFVTERNLWYVHVGGSADVNEARAIRERFRQEENFKEAWILTVQ